MEVERIQPGSGCSTSPVSRLLGNAAAAVDYLQTPSNAEKLDRARLLNEPDFDPIRQNPLFDAFLKSLPE